LFLTGFYRFKNAIPSRSLPLLSVALLVCVKRMSTEKEVERDIDSVEVGENDVFFVGFNDSMELGKKYGAQLGIMHVLELSLMVLFKKKGINSGYI
jgi:hypothetical protein